VFVASTGNIRKEELRHQELTQKIKKEKVRRKELIAQLKGWNRANALRQNIEEVKKRSDAAPAWPVEAVNRWLT